MARPLRIEYPNAYYHVSNKSEEGYQLFPGAKFYEGFLTLLEEALTRFHVEVHAWCLLKNEYHLLLKTPEGNLSRFMRQVDGSYTQFYQNRRSEAGSIFHSRYKAVLIQPKPYLLEVSRYIHRLGVSGRKSALDASWSSMAGYSSKAKAPAWLVRDEVLAQLDAKSSAAYVKFVNEGVSAELQSFYARKNLLSVLGDPRFTSTARSKAAPGKPRGKAKGKQARLRPSITQVVSAVAKFYKVSDKSIYQAARGPSSKNIPRWVAMHLCQELSAVTLQEIASRFGLKRYGTVSTTIGKLRQELADNPATAKAVSILTKRLSAS